MVSSPDIFQAAQAIRPYLPELLTPADADAMAHRLELALRATTDSSTQQAEILSVLSAADLTREWLRLYQEEQKPTADILNIIRTYHPLPGKAGVVASPRYCCPVASCHQTWYRREASVEVPDCPIHGIKMVRESKVQEADIHEG